MIEATVDRSTTHWFIWKCASDPGLCRLSLKEHGLAVGARLEQPSHALIVFAGHLDHVPGVAVGEEPALAAL